MASRVYYDTAGIPNAPTWTPVDTIGITNWIKIRIVDTINQPLFFEIWIADPNNTIQNAGTFYPFQRIRIDCERNGIYSAPIVGRIEYIDSKSDDSYGQYLILQCKDFCLELTNRIPDYDFTNSYWASAATTKNELIARIIQYVCYTEIAYGAKAGAAFTINPNYYLLIDNGLGDQARCRTIFDNNTGVTGTLVVDHVEHEDLTNQIAAGDAITEYNATGVDGIPKATDPGVATTATANVVSIYRTIDTAFVEAMATLAITNEGNFLGDSTPASDVIEEIAYSDTNGLTRGYDFYSDFGVAAATSQQFHYFRRATEASGMTLAYNTAETATIKAMHTDYYFPTSAKEFSTHIIAQGRDANNTIQTREGFSGTLSGQLAWNIKTFKDTKIIQTQQGNTTDLAAVRDAGLAKLSSANIQRGTVRITGYPFRTDTNALLRVGQVVTISLPAVTAVDGSVPRVISIDYEEPPGIATIELLGNTGGVSVGDGEKKWGFSERIHQVEKGIEKAVAIKRGIERFPGNLSYTDEDGNVYIVSESLIFQNSSEVNVATMGYRVAGANNPDSLMINGPGGGAIFGINTTGFWHPAGMFVWPFSDVAAYLYFRTRNKANSADVDHIFAPSVTNHGRLGDATHIWLSAHIKNLDASGTLTLGGMKWGTDVTNNTGLGNDTARITHGFNPSTPTVVIATIQSGTGEFTCGVTNIGATTFDVVVKDITTASAAGSAHAHGTSVLGTSANAATHGHGISGNTTVNDVGGDPHQHAVSGGAATVVVANDGDTHTHTITNNTDNESSHTHTQQVAVPGGAVTIHWVAFL